MRRVTVVSAAVCMVVLAFTMIAAAQGSKVAGTWEITMQGRQGPMTNTLTLEQDGNKLKGTLKTQRGETPLEGSVEGNKVNFTITRETPNGKFEQNFTGTVEGDTMKGTVKMGEREAEWSAKKK